MEYINKKIFFNMTKPMIWLGVFALAYLVFALLAAFFSFRETSLIFREELDNRLMNGSRSLYFALPEDFVKKGTLDPRLSHEEYIKIDKRLSALATQLGFPYLFSLISKEGKYYFSSVALNQEELTHPEDYHYLALYQEAPLDVLKKALETGKPQFHKHEDLRGELLTLFLPMQGENGQKFLLCSSVKMPVVYKAYLERFFAQLIFIVLLLTSFLPLFFYLRSLMRR